MLETTFDWKALFDAVLSSVGLMREIDSPWIVLDDVDRFFDVAEVVEVVEAALGAAALLASFASALLPPFDFGASLFGGSAFAVSGGALGSGGPVYFPE